MVDTPFINGQVMASIDAAGFQAQRPYPWANPQYFIQPGRYGELLDSLPPLTQFRAFFGKTRKHGQGSHDRYVLDYERGMALAPAWRECVEELCGAQYRRFICGLLGVSSVRFRFHWHFTPRGGEVTPHCDSRGKIGSQIFYLNTERDWQWDWGGETVILDDGGRFPADSAPGFDDFDEEIRAQTRDNRSLIFGRRGNSWHGVRPIRCPGDHHRKVFIVVFEEHRPLRTALKKARRLAAGRERVTEKEKLMY